MNVENKTSDAQIKATRRWEENNPEKKRYQRVRSNARTFARRYARSREEVEELLAIFDEENENAEN
ncbi:hypothetical protein [Aedoeadaptatus coxii]|uniref:hypothetical protein n=1 Tax=Aedoeadaptatus coxii TaxID=755172 RepID=UPI002AD3BD4D|nr:hypothetical protein [Peptoniphilus coxii]